uniref:U3 small nucleolar RNA-associated protein 4 homolog n=1 Tax=Ciona intestinalis TaxID=7719 RepID=F6Y0M4_CIOIN|nr:U3 small nucleolar RNA-associated protein 4 homolog [Ciona intestinalis]|eukprot:XP_002128329.1 U3 small nucleolar RNA-associated protein 4 homolog [Ciona intestinalis]
MECKVHRFRLYNYNPRAVQCIAVSDNSQLAVGRSDGSIEIWCTEECWFQKMVIPGSENGSVESLLWLGNRLISAGLHGNVVEYDLTSGTVKILVDSFGGAVWCLGLSPTHTHIAAGCEDGSIKMLETSNKSLSFERSFDKQEGRIMCMAWHESGDVIVTGSVDVIRLWSIKTGHAVQRITLERDMKKVETIVWDVLVLSDYTVVSGDSFGRIQFWNGKHGTLLQSLHVHRADVLTLCRGTTESSIYAAGVDPRVLSFKLTNSEDPTSWVKGPMLQKHTHDVRSLALVNDLIVSGGVDTNLMVNSVSRKKDKFKRIYSFPSYQTVSVAQAANLVLLQYSTYLEVWKMGTSVDNTETKSKVLPLEEQPLKMVQLKVPTSSVDHIKCSSISSCGHWIAYSTTSTFRLYHLTYKHEESNIQVQKVRCSGLSPSHVIRFSQDSNIMITASTNHKVMITKLDSSAHTANLVHSHSLKCYTSPTLLLSISNDSTHFAVANLEGQVDVFNAKNMTHVCSLPRYTRIPTAISFHPKTNDVVVVYDDLQIFEFSIKSAAYTPWTRGILSANSKEKYLARIHKAVMRKHSNIAVVNNILHVCEPDKDIIMCVSREGMFIIEKPSRKKGGDKSRFCHQFMPLLHCDIMDDSTMLVVERPLQDIWDQLPATLYQKKFGT